MTTLFKNPWAGDLPETSLSSKAPLEFHRKLPHYAPTPLVDAPDVAERLGLRRVVVKNESSRFALPSFKLLGASWATYRALRQRHGEDFGPWSTIEELRQRLAPLKPFSLAAATDGNHGRAVARMARLVEVPCQVFVPKGTAPARIRAIEKEGATVSVVDGDYDATIARSAEEESKTCLVIDDTSWPGYEQVPRWVAEGYSTIFREVAEQMDRDPDAVFVPIGVGALGAAATDYFKRREDVVVAGVEPESAACLLESIRAGEIVTVPGPHPSIMAGLNCGTPSPVAFPTLRAGVDWCVAIEDPYAEEAMRTLDACGIESGETGAAALGGLEAVLASGNPMQLDPSTTALVIVTEGPTDPASFERIVGHTPHQD